jgi:hypothetical protein
MVLFCAVASTSDFIEIRATIGGAVMSPSVSQILSAPGATESRCANFYKGGLPAGTRTVQMQSITGGGVPSVLFSRSMIVIVNVR